MLVYINGGQQNFLPQSLDINSGPIVFLGAEEAEGNVFYSKMRQSKKPYSSSRAAHFQGHPGMDYLMLLLPGKGGECQIFLRGKALLFVVPNVAKLQSEEADFFSFLGQKSMQQPDVVLAEFLLALTENKIAELYRIETRIAGLEDKLLQQKNMNYSKSISEMRKLLLGLKQYYQSFVMLVEDMQENLNEHMGPAALKTLAVVQKRAERVYGSVLYLRDYVTQLRESYQTEMDLTLNEIMKLFTLVTVIFMPLGLVVGWYGMNLKMPETAWEGMYVLIIVLCVAIAVGTVWYFRRKKWF